MLYKSHKEQYKKTPLYKRKLISKNSTSVTKSQKFPDIFNMMLIKYVTTQRHCNKVLEKSIRIHTKHKTCMRWEAQMCIRDRCRIVPSQWQ